MPINILEILSLRRSIRKFLNKPVENEKIKVLAKAVSLAPSSNDSRPWKIIFIKNKKKRKEYASALASVHKYSRPLLNAPLIAVVTVDQRLSPNHFVEDGSIAAFSMWLAATSIDLGAVWCATYHPKHTERECIARKILRLPDNYRIICSLGIGYPAEGVKKKKIRNINAFTKSL